MSETLRLTPTATVTIESEAPDLLVVEARYDPSPGRPPLHLHPEQDERFVVLEGVLHAEVEGRARVVGEGAALEVPRGTAHTIWTPAGPARVRWETRPAGRTPDFFRQIDVLLRERRLGDFEAVLADYRDVFVLAG